MPDPAQKSTGRDQAIRNARLRLIELEIETHRIKAELARLEADREEKIVEQLIREFPLVEAGDISPASWKRITPEAELARFEARTAAHPAVPAKKVDSKPAVVDATPNSAGARKEKRRSVRRRVWWLKSLRTAPAWVVSLLFHAGILALFGVVTFVSFQADTIPLLASSVQAPAEELAETIDVEIAQPELEETTFQEVALETSTATVDELTARDFAQETGDVGANLGDQFGFVDTLPGDIGTLLAGPGGGRPAGGGRPGRASFFGTRSEGKRFLFVIDNSGSMQNGRIETTFFELTQSVQSMEPDQYFYVIFYSDQAYPMFFPEPAERMLEATAENKQRLEDWLPTVELCMGGRLIDALKLASALKPQVVYLLSDGEMGGSALRFATDSSQRTFSLHTLGMGVDKPEAAEALQAIAAAHGGTFRLVEPSAAAIQLAAQRPIKYNRQRGNPWGSKMRSR